MKANVGGVDRVLRMVVGLAMISQVFVGLTNPLGWLGVVPLLTGLFKFCPFYPLIGCSTCSKDEG
ncbi:MAG: DUF2892 domain-containing protein [Magnetococcales bacterium]|nr:DUF2892 domain-containing protein [Magnetococcales bacterium]